MEHDASTFLIITHTLGFGQKVKTFFSEIFHIAYQIRREWSIEHHTSTYSALTSTLGHWGWVKRSIHYLSESSHIAYQIKENRAPFKHIYCPYTRPRPLWGQKVKTFFSESGRAAYQIKANGAYLAPCKHIFCPYKNPRQPVGRVKSQKNILNVVMLHIKLKGKKY